ncbi:hypothetical protein ABZ281_41560 [Streptomyces sp. NPDC006265]|uniref:hypothetical protein n=1 Tax=Streptomyces sp. NPDC006265 TaxID=3156740 RepID=UPI0033B6EE47
MTKILLSLHVLAAIVAVGPVTVAAGMFPPATRRATPGGGIGTPALLLRICRVYAGVGLTVPALGFATAAAMGVLGSGWLITSIALTAPAAGILVAFVLPRQEELLDRLKDEQAPDHRDTVQLAMFAGIFNLPWATVTVLMIVRPGSTTGA